MNAVSTAASLIAACLAMLGLAVVIALTVMRPRHQQPPEHLHLAVGLRDESSEGAQAPEAVQGTGRPRAKNPPPAEPTNGTADDAEAAEPDRGSSQDLHMTRIPLEGID